MLLPKRIQKHLTRKEINQRLLRGSINLLQVEDKYLLDEENSIIVVRNNNSLHHDEDYIMIHERLINGKLIEINKWYMRTYFFGLSQKEVVIEDLNLFKVQKDKETFDALYDYKNDKFVVPKGSWDSLDFGCNNKNIENYNGILATFSISSDYENGDILSYTNPATKEEVIGTIEVGDGNYYAILNLDGTIRENKFFKGNEIVNLDEYDSLSKFKKERKKICNAKKQRLKQEFYKIIEAGGEGAKVLKLTI